MARKKGRMAFSHDNFDRYKSSTSREQNYKAVTEIAWLQHDSHQYFKQDSGALKKWQKECIELYSLVNEFSFSMHVKEKSIADLLEGFIHEFEHVERRLRELLNHKSIPKLARQSYKDATDLRLNSCFRFAVYALLLDDRIKRKGEVPYVTKTEKIRSKGTQEESIVNLREQGII